MIRLLYPPPMHEAWGANHEWVPLLVPLMPSADDLLPFLRDIDKNRQYTNFGPLNDRFVQALREHVFDTNDGHVFGAQELGLCTVANATLGLEVAIESLGLDRGARILCPSLTFPATASAITRSGFDPVFADVDPLTWCLTPEIAEAALAEMELGAIVPVATFGLPLDVSKWDQFTATTGVPVVIDAAGAVGAQKVGELCHVVFSFHATKSLGIGEGGVVASRNARFIDEVESRVNFGIVPSATSTRVAYVGTNAKLSEYHAAVGLAALPIWQASLDVRETLSRDYRRLLIDRSTGVSHQEMELDRFRSLFVVALPEGRSAQDITRKLATWKVSSRRWYCPPLHQQEPYASAARTGGLLSTESLGMRLLGLPFFPGLGQHQLVQVVDALVAALNESIRESVRPEREGAS